MISRVLSRIPIPARFELLLIVSVMLLSVLLFRTQNWDNAGIAHFYHPELSDPWPTASTPFLKFLYHVAPILTVGMGLAGLWLIASSFIRGRSRYHRWMGIFLVSSILLGPGIIVNAIFKEHWERPRPRQTVEFGGDFQYHPLWQKGHDTHGKSFPCGHCSVGFILLALWYWWRRRRPKLGLLCFGFTLIIGGLLGVARMSAGAHYPSDVLWSLLFCWFTCWLLYYPVFALYRIPDCAERNDPHAIPTWKKSLLYGGVCLTGAILILSALVATPYAMEESGEWVLKRIPQSIQIDNQTRNKGWWVEIRQDPTLPLGTIAYEAQWRGHALPGKSLQLQHTETNGTLQITLQTSGWFTDIEGVLLLRIPVNVDPALIEVRAAERLRHLP
jgi:membrane-associated PAP2 superfamily phosphatase